MSEHPPEPADRAVRASGIGPSGRPGAVVDGVDVDAVAAAARACPGVERLHGGHPQRVETYLPGRRVEGVRVDRRAVVVQVRARWGVSAVELAAQVRAAVAPLASGRRIDIVVAEIGDPPLPAPPLSSGAGGALGRRP